MSPNKIKQELLETGETLFCCPQCPFKADKLQTTKVHMLRHTGQFTCLKCKKSCRSQKDLESHMKNVHKEPTVDDETPVQQQQQKLKIKLEGNEVTPPRDRSRLGRRQKSVASNAQFRCQYCEYATDRKLLLNQHCKYHLNSPMIKHLCPACFKPFPSPYHVKRHIFYNHPDATYSLIKIEPKKSDETLEVKTEVKETTTPVTKVTKRKAAIMKRKRKRKGRPKNVATVKVEPNQEEVKKSPEQEPIKEKEATLPPETTPDPVVITPEPRTSTFTFQCAHCKYGTNQKNLLRQHMTYHSSKYKCQKCEKSFPCASRLELHLDRIHDKKTEENDEENIEENEDGDQQIDCKVKNEPITSLWGFDLSDFGIDAIVLNDEMADAGGDGTTPAITNILPTYSSNAFPNEGFNVQTESPTDVENPFSCPFCPYRGKKKRNLDSHMVYHTDKFKCETCSKRHPTLYHLNRHIRLVHCGNPEESFAKREPEEDQQSSPSLYFPVESSEIKEESECSLPFNLTDLMAVEATEDLNGTIKLEPDSDCESPGDCDDTGLTTVTAMETLQTTLPNEIHFSIQSDGQKIFYCSDCPYQNTKKQNVKQHRKIHTQQYACPKCGKGNTTSYHLRRHLGHGSCSNNNADGTKILNRRKKKINGQA